MDDSRNPAGSQKIKFLPPRQDLEKRIVMLELSVLSLSALVFKASTKPEHDRQNLVLLLQDMEVHRASPEYISKLFDEESLEDKAPPMAAGAGVAKGAKIKISTDDQMSLEDKVE